MRTAIVVAIGVLIMATGCSLPEAGAGDAAPSATAQIVKLAVHKPDTCQGYVSLTFDDGPTALTNRLLDVLTEYQVPAVFFNTGEHSAALPKALAAQRALPGAQFGNHTWDHKDLGTLAPAQVRSELEQTRALQGPEVTFFRPPFGNAPAAVAAEVKRQKLVQVLWTHDSKDFDATSAQQVVERAKGMKDGGIVLLHDGHVLTIRALPFIISYYYEQGLCFGKVVETTTPQAPVESPELTFFAKAVAP